MWAKTCRGEPGGALWRKGVLVRTDQPGELSSVLGAQSQVQLLSWQGGGARTPQHQCLDASIKKNKINTQGPKPHSLISALIGHWEMPVRTQLANLYSGDLWHSLRTELCKEVTSSDWTERLSFQKTMKIDWTQTATQKVSVQGGSYAQKPLIHWSSRGCFISSLSWSSTPKITNPAQKPARHPIALGCIGCAKALLGARGGSRCGGHRARQSFSCLSLVWGPDALRSDTAAM